jgi:hypothetical protein
LNEVKVEVVRGSETGLTNWKRDLLESVEGDLKKVEPREFQKKRL